MYRFKRVLNLLLAGAILSSLPLLINKEQQQQQQQQSNHDIIQSPLA